MNYFPFHIGDYAAHTGHLEPMEDLAYMRLIKLYYLREGPLPTDVQETAKLVRMRSMLSDVESVLKEFFVLTDAGWSHQRCEAEIAKMQDKQSASEERDEHEKTRQQKHRERRSAMFSQLADVGVYPTWNAKTGELERLISEHCGTPVTAPVTAPVTRTLANGETVNGTKPVTGPVTHETLQASPVTAPATAIPTPTPTPTPTPKKNTFSTDLLTESEPDVPTGFLIPLNDGTEYPIPERDLAEWERAYLAVDVQQELREIRTWSLANKAKRKTRTGVARFIVAWLSKAQDNPGASRPKQNPEQGVFV